MNNCYIPLKSSPNTKIILETDLCCDVDDVGAIALLCYAVKQYGLTLSAISVNVNGPLEAASADAMLHLMGIAQVPVAVWGGENPPSGNQSAYLNYLSEQLPPERRSTLRSLSPEALYHEILASSEDGGVVVISVGFFCNLAAAYRADPALFDRKVRSVVAMAGTFVGSPENSEFNVREMPADARDFIANYAGRIDFVPFETGEHVITDLRDGMAPHHPVYECYRLYTKDSLMRPSWDPVAVDFAVNGENDRYGLSPSGRVQVSEQGVTRFEEHAGGRHFCLQFKQSDEEIGRHITAELIAACQG